jgi:hypothetical protein
VLVSAFQHLAHEALGSFCISPTLNQHIEDKTVLVDRPPQPMASARDADHHLVEVLFVAKAAADKHRILLAK